jgi:2,3-bisphosphoglycerate-independent phosphoglycerate mutase
VIFTRALGWLFSEIMSGTIGVRPLVLVLLDGWGIRAEHEGNALAAARTPIYDRLAGGSPHAILTASGEAVGLAPGRPGNAQAGYMTLGAGRPITQNLLRVNRAMQADDPESIADHPVFRRIVQRVRPLGGAVHLVGLVSPAGIAGHQNHLAVLAALLSHEGVQVWIHAVTDGIDAASQGGIGYLTELLDDTAGAEHAAVGSVIGRALILDEPTDPAAMASALKAIATAEAPRTEYPTAHLDQCYLKGIDDDRVPPVVTPRYRGIRQDDAVFLVNLRADSGRSFMEALVASPTAGLLSGAYSLCEIAGSARSYVEPFFPAEPVPATLSETVARAGRSQLLLTETISETNLSLFLRGGTSQIFDGETLGVAETPLSKIEKRPELAAGDLLAEALDEIKKAERDLLILNLVNVAAVGRTGNMRATVEAAEAIDKCLGKLAAQVEKRGGLLAITSAFGKGELMIDPDTGRPWRGTTRSNVPFTLVGKSAGAALRFGTLADVAPTILSLLDIPVPEEMSGSSLLVGAEQASRVSA